MTKHKNRLIIASFILILSLMFLYQRYLFNSWASFVSNGVIIDRILKKNNTLIYGANGAGHPILYFLDVFNRNKVETIDLNTGNAMPQAFFKNNVLVTADDVLTSIDINSKEIKWQVTSEEQKFFRKVVVYNNKVLASSADGSLYAYAPKSGKLLWKFTPKKTDNLLSSMIQDGNLNYFGYFTPEAETIYIASSDKSLYALSLKTGKVIWNTEIGSTSVSEPRSFGKYLYLTTYLGESIAVDKYSGEVLWKSANNSQSYCFEVRSSFENFNNPWSQLLSRFSEGFRNLFIIGPVSFYEMHKDGTFIRRDAKTGSIIWQAEKLPAELNCPTYWKSRVVFTGNKGNFIIMSMITGKKFLDQNTFGKMLNPALLDVKFGKFIPEWLNVFIPNYFVNNADGELFLVKGGTSRVIWKFSAEAPSKVLPLVDKNKIYYSTSDGVVYKINKRNGISDLPSYNQHFKLSESVKNVSDTQIREFTLESNMKFTNPWREALLDAKFVHESGLTIEVPGFYYDKNIWKLRFNPPLKGIWKWEINWSPSGKNTVKSGEFISMTDTSKFYLRTNENNPKRLTVDGSTIFNGVGLGDTFHDYNYNGTSLDDWAFGNSDQVVATDSSGLTVVYKSDKLNSLNEYINAYGPKGAGFNMFRWSVMNASQSLYTYFGYPTTYSILQGKIGDDLVDGLKSNDIHLWFTIFGFDVPYKDSSIPHDKYLLKSYARYIYARYGAYVDVWEVANEIAVPKDTATLLFDEIRSYDYEKRPISISSVSYNYEQSDIIAPHWYETEKIEESDIKTVQHIDAFKGINKPVVFAEQGNHTANHDETSAIRMRIRLWTAYFKEGIIMFWNQSDTKNFKANIFSANIYLGQEEQSYVKVLQNFTSSFPLESKKVDYELGRYGVRGYGLNSDNLVGVYFYHFASPFSFTSFTLPLYTKNGGQVKWIDPENGKVIKEDYCSPTKCVLISPSFKTDISLSVTKI